jgi:hypothetical protein
MASYFAGTWPAGFQGRHRLSTVADCLAGFEDRLRLHGRIEDSSGSRTTVRPGHGLIGSVRQLLYCLVAHRFETSRDAAIYSKYFQQS